MIKKFFSGRVGTARLFFFAGLAFIISALSFWMSDTFLLIPEKFAILVACFLGTLGLVGMINGGIQIAMINREGSAHDFH